MAVASKPFKLNRFKSTKFEVNKYLVCILLFDVNQNSFSHPTFFKRLNCLKHEKLLQIFLMDTERDGLKHIKKRFKVFYFALTNLKSWP